MFFFDPSAAALVGVGMRLPMNGEELAKCTYSIPVGVLGTEYPSTPGLASPTFTLPPAAWAAAAFLEAKKLLNPAPIARISVKRIEGNSVERGGLGGKLEPPLGFGEGLG